MGRQGRGKRNLAKTGKAGASYSPIQHLAYALFLNHNPHERFFVMLNSYTAYFDASGTKQAKLIVVAGYIASVHDWLIFEKEWKMVLEKVGVPHFHMKKFTACRKPFDNKKWRREQYRKDFLERLIGVIARNVDYGPINILSIADWETVNKEYCMQEERMTPFSIAGCMAITGAYQWCKDNAVPSNKVKFIFEDGDEDKGDLMYWCKRCWKFTPIFEPKYLDEPTSYPITPLQACDFVAWEARRAETDATDAGGNLDTLELRRCFNELRNRVKLDEHHQKWSPDNLRELCKIHGIKKRDEGTNG